jgi:hypothetical protein
MPKKWLIGLVSSGLLLAACSTSPTSTPAPPSDPTLKDALPPDVALNVQNQISEILQVPVENIKLEKIEQMDWPDGCLGLPEGDEACVQAITPGWLLTFHINNQEYKYRIDKTGTVIRQEP